MAGPVVAKANLSEGSQKLSLEPDPVFSFKGKEVEPETRLESHENIGGIYKGNILVAAFKDWRLTHSHNGNIVSWEIDADLYLDYMGLNLFPNETYQVRLFNGDIERTGSVVLWQVFYEIACTGHKQCSLELKGIDELMQTMNEG